MKKQEIKHPEDIEKYGTYYSEPKLWRKVKRVEQKGGLKVIYLVLLLYYVFQSPNGSFNGKANVYGA